MDKQNIRLFLVFSLMFVGMILFNKWQGEHVNDAGIDTQSSQQALNTSSNELSDITIPRTENEMYQGKPSNQVIASNLDKQFPEDRLVHVKTEHLNAKIDRLGGDIVFLELLKYPVELGKEQGFALFDTESRYLVAESGLLSQQGPDIPQKGKGLYKTNQQHYFLKNNQDVLVVDLYYQHEDNIKITKRFEFKKDSYTITQKYLINNQSSQPYKVNAFARLKRSPADESGTGFLGAMKTYTGAAVRTVESKYEKLPFDKLEKKPFTMTMQGGWAAMVEHYFTAAWIPSGEKKHHYEGKKLQDGIYSIGFTGSTDVVAPGEQQELVFELYAGPEITSTLKAISPGLELTVDYGVLWWLCQPIFLVLKTIYDVVGNWGVSIILTTLCIKALFYKLSAASYRSMGNMKRVQPKMALLKERYGEDKQKFGQAMMELYKKEKINPLGGCLPILIQIPVFIALYYVLLESVELRQAPFFLWIHDLSVKDPFYVLPLIMGASMFIQQKLNPTPPDPVQAKVMMFMPVFFTVLFLQFPAGLVLYWVVNNFLSILQQWFITKNMEEKIS